MADLSENSIHETMILVDGGEKSSVEEHEVSIPIEEEEASIRKELTEKIQNFVESQDEITDKRKKKEELELEEALANLKKLTTIFIIPFVASLIGRKLSVYIWRWFTKYL